MHRIHKLGGKKIAYVLGALFSIISLGTLIVVATNSDNGIPDDVPQTLGNAFVKILGNNWETNDFVGKTMQLGGFTGSLYVQSTTGFTCGTTSTGAYKFLTNINRNGTYSCNAQQSSTLRIKAILATIRDVDVACTGSVKINGTPIGTTDAQDIREGDKLETGGCSMSSLYFVDHSIVRLAANTTITLRSAGTPSGSGTTDVTLNQGELWARVLKPITDDSYFNISSQEGSVGVRGTSVYVGRNTSSGTLDAIALDSGTLPSPTSSLGVMTLLASGAIRQESIPIAKYVQMKESTLRVNQYISTRKDARINRDGGVIDSSQYIKTIEDAEDKFYGIQDIREIQSSTMTKTPDVIYSGNDFVRRATLADLRDWDDLYRFDRGNLKTISMTGGWLRTNSGAIQTGTGYSSNPQGIDKTEPKIFKEFAYTEPADQSEQQSICTNSKFGSNSVGCDITYYADYTIPGANKTIFKRDESNHFIFNPQEPVTPGHTGSSLESVGISSLGFNSRDALLEYPLAYKIENQSGATLEVEIGNYVSGNGTYMGGDCFDYSQPASTLNKTLFRRKIVKNSCILGIGGNVITTNLGLKYSDLSAWSLRTQRITQGETIRLFRIRK